MARIAITIRLPEETWGQLKKACVDRRKPMQAVILELVEEWLKSQKEPTTKR